MHKDSGKTYRPSNGTDGMYFVDTYCMNCRNCDPNPDGKRQCNILARSMAYNHKDPEYPKEWVYDEEGEPSCIAYKYWNWSRMGDPDDINNKNYVPPFNPNQLKLFPDEKS